MSLKTKYSGKTVETTGFGTNSSQYGGRLMHPNGRPNIQKTGTSIFDRMSWYHTLIDMSTGKFLLIIFTSFLVVNLVFGLAYFSIGVEHLIGVTAATTAQKFVEAYFFSAQTFTTVGYG